MKKAINLISLLVLLFAINLIAKQGDKYLDETFFVQPTTSISELHKKFGDILSRANTNKYSVAVYSLDKNHFYYEKNANIALTPASLTKLFTTYNSIKTVGFDFKYKTKAYIEGVVKNDTLFGSIVIEGSGDPLLTINDLEYLADQISNYGIKVVTGDLIADGRVFDKIFHRIKYSGDADVVEPTPPISGLSIDRNTVTVLVTAGKSGQKTNVQCFPNSDYFRVINNSLVSGKTKGTKKIKSKKTTSLMDDYRNYYGDELRKRPKKSPITISSKETNELYQTINVNGRLSPGSSYSYQLFINNPNLAFAGALASRLTSSNVKFLGKYREVEKNEIIFYSNLIEIANIERNIWDVINLTNKNSDNYLAESLFKLYANMIAKKSSKSYIDLRDSLSKKLYLECEECMLNDGSGLSRRNLVTTRTIINLLKNAYNSEYRDLYLNSLSIGGIDGTIRKRFKSNSSYNNVKAKTGTLRNVSGLAGYVKSLDGENLIFAFIFNGSDVGNYKYIENQLAEHLASFYIDINLSNE